MSEQRARDRVEADHPCFAGHFPGRPIVPGVVLLERVALAVSRTAGRPLRLQEIPAAKFVQPLLPGEDFDITWTGEPGAVRFRCLRDGQVLAQGTMVLA